MTRLLFDETRIHPAIRQKMAEQGQAVIAEVQAAVATHAIVVVGMGLNPFPRAARKWLDDAGIPYHYLGYGNYLSDWRKRLSLKLWSGWTTFPMIFIDGDFIGGADDLKRLGVDAVKKAAGASSKRV